MGVKKLWSILVPHGSKVSIIELQGKHIAVDLSGWICENQVVGERYNTQPKLHLRNIFFRSTLLLLYSVLPIFILDGELPNIKQSTVSKRNQIRFQGRVAGKDNEQDNKKGQRKMLKSALKESQEMLSLMGLTCLWSDGEGEAFCAFLDEKGIVDGVITNDSDAFLYGAKKVYRNFTINSGSGTVDVFDMLHIEKRLNLTREKLIAMSLLCGCDYDGTGVHGIGPEQSLKYLSNFRGDILYRFRELKNDRKLELYEVEKESCKKCHHPGKQQEHAKQGCNACGVGSSCIRSTVPFAYERLDEEKKAKVDFELKIRSKIAKNSAFPDEAAISEYLCFSQEIPDLNLHWEEPNVSKFISFMERKCNWCTCYGFEKIIPLYCRWALVNSKFTFFSPKRILKKRVFKAVPCFDLEWSGNCTFCCDVHENTICGESFTTVEPQLLVMDKCREMYDEYVNEVNEKRVAKKQLKKKNNRKESRNESDSADVLALISSVSQLSLADTANTGHSRTKLKCDDSLHSNKEGKSKYNFTSEDQLSIISIEQEDAGIDISPDQDLTGVWQDINLSDYEIDESLIVDSIISRRQYY